MAVKKLWKLSVETFLSFFTARPSHTSSWCWLETITGKIHTGIKLYCFPQKQRKLYGLSPV